MSDIVDRLRLLVPSDSSGAAFDGVNEITRLRAENERLKRSRDRYRVAWTEEKRRFTAARAAMEETSNDKA